MESLEVGGHDRLILELAKQQVFDLDAKIGEVEQRIARLAQNDHSISVRRIGSGFGLIAVKNLCYSL